MATRRVLAALVTAAARAGHPRVVVESVGGVDAARRVSAGEPFDLVFLASDALGALAAAGHVEAASVTPLLLSRVAVAVSSDSDEPATDPGTPAFRDADGVRAALRAAGRIGYSTGPSGRALLRMIDDWGLTDELGPHLVQAPPGVPVARLLAEGGVDLGLQQLSELAGENGVRVLGVLPPDCAIDTVFSGAVATAASGPGAARDLLAFLASAEVAPIRGSHGFEDA